MQQVRAYVVDADASVRRLIRSHLEAVGIAVSPFGSAEALFEAYQPGLRGCVVAEMLLPGMGGLPFLRRFKELDAVLPVILMASHGSTRSAVRALKEGAFDFLEKPLDKMDLIEVVQRALQWEANQREAMVRHAELRRRIETLSPREREVMDLVVSGMANKQVADLMGLSQRTVETHRNHVMQKMGATNLATLVQLVLDSRLRLGDPNCPFRCRPGASCGVVTCNAA